MAQPELSPDASVEKESSYQNESMVLKLNDDSVGTVQQVLFKRDGGSDVLSAAAELMGHAAGSHVRCFHLPMFEKVLGWSVHLYINLQGVSQNLPHNTLATQLWLVANLPGEPPRVQPDSISGAALVTAEVVTTEEFVQLDLEQWETIVDVCRKIQPNAQFSV